MTTMVFPKIFKWAAGVFTSPSPLAKTVFKAESLYKSSIKQAFKDRGLWRKGYNFDIQRAIVQGADETGLSVRLLNKSGEELFGVSRTFGAEEVGLSTIGVANSLRRRGLAKGLYQSELGIFEKLGYKPGTKIESPVVSPYTEKLQRRMYGSEFIGTSRMMEGKIPGFDDAYNTIEGLRHGGIAQWLRKKFTDFGSGWDKLRALARQGETFQEMLTKKSFKQALSQAEPVKKLGAGMYGEVSLMKTTFRGEEFKFARKIGDIGPNEPRALQELQDTVAPSLYSHSKGQLDMEYIQGETLYDIVERAGTRAAKKMRKAPNVSLELVGAKSEKIFNWMDSLRKKVDTGEWVHGDLHLGNLMLVKTPQGRKLSVIDWGISSKKGDLLSTSASAGKSTRPEAARGFVSAVNRKLRFESSHTKGVRMASRMAKTGGRGHLKQTGKSPGSW